LRFAPTFGGISFLSELFNTRRSVLGLGGRCAGWAELVTDTLVCELLGMLSFGALQEGRLWSFHLKEG